MAGEDSEVTTDATVDFLADLRLNGKTVDELPQRLMPADLLSAYGAQNALVDRLIAHWGGERAGYKIALTNPAAQAMLGVPHPVFGQLISSRVHESGVVLPASAYAVRIIECEVAFRMRSTPAPDGRPYDRRSIIEHVGAALPAIELVEHHFAGIGRVTPESLAADNAIHGAWIHGEPMRDFAAIDLGAQRTRLDVNGETKLTGSSDRVLGHPLNVLAWLANTLPEYGLALRAGDYVTTGITTDEIYHAQAGERVTAFLGELGTVTIQFE